MFGGDVENDLQSSNSIEFLNIPISDSWSLIILSNVSPRASPILCPVNETQIAIIGGWGRDYEDAYVYDTESCVCTASTFVTDTWRSMCPGDQNIKVNDGTMISYTKRDDFVQYSFKENTFTVQSILTEADIL